MSDNVDHPVHYRGAKGIECIDVIEDMPFWKANVIKYVWREDSKGGLEDLKKAAWYLAREIQRRESNAPLHPY